VCQHVVLTTDAALLLATGTPQGWGLALVAGTGSIAYGQTPEGRTARAGGWGYLLGDEGSAYALVLAALRAVARAADGRSSPTCLTENFLRKLGLNQPQQLIPELYGGGWDRASLAALAPLVFAAADAGDSSALALIEQGALDLAAMVSAVACQLEFDRRAVPLALAGGVLMANTSYRERVLRLLPALGLQPDPVGLVHEPARGAVQLARDAQSQQ
jgi:N-acetylglucosamine kinase-like BadF-type ATPase